MSPGHHAWTDFDGAGVITRRWPAALAVISALLFFGDGETPPLESFAAILVFMPVAYLVFGWARRELAEAGPWQSSLPASSRTPCWPLLQSCWRTAGRYVLAAGWLGHAAWDLHYHYTGRVVPRLGGVVLRR